MPLEHEHQRSACNINVLGLIPVNGTHEIDIRAFTAQIAIYESMYDLYVRGSLVIVDADNLAQSLPITGLERLRINISLPSDDAGSPVIDGEYVITGIVNKHNAQQGQELYVLDFASDYYYDSITTHVSKAFTNVSAGEAIQMLYEDTVRVIADPTDGIINVITPNIQKELAARLFQTYAINEDGINDYMLFANRLGIQFRSLKNLYAQPALIPLYQIHENLPTDQIGPPDTDLVINPPRSQYEKEDFVTQSEMYKMINPVGAIVDGALNARLYTFNPLTGAVHTYDHRIQD